MKQCGGFVCIFALMALFPVVTPAAAADWRFPVGLSYVSGITEVVDLYEDNLEAEGYDVDRNDGVPIGLSFNPYVELENGLGFGIGIGPTMLIADDADLFVLPVRVDLRYAVMPRSEVSPYLRVGGSYPLASGDYVEQSRPGLFGGIGIEFFREKVVGFGLEAAYDSSVIEFEDVEDDSTKEIQPVKFMVSLFAIF